MALRHVSALVAVTLVSGCGYGGALEDARRETSAPSVIVTVDPAATPHDVVTYLKLRKDPDDGASTEGGVRLKSPDDLAKLNGASADFKSFVGWQLRANIATVQASLAARGKKGLPARCELPAKITVWGIAPDVAMGREWWCTRDANEAIWSRSSGTWHVAARMRGGWDCSVLDHYKVPAAITAAVCFEKGGRAVRRYNGPA
jgi:hypothetical protein